MNYIEKHLNNEEVRGRETYYSSSPLYEYVTCVQGKKDPSWVCIKGAYELVYDVALNYDYKVMKIVAMPFNTAIFELRNPGHTIVPKPKPTPTSS